MNANQLLRQLSICFLLGLSSLTQFGFAQEAQMSGYVKTEHMVKMRDGVSLYTAVYRPSDTSKTYPILFTRTPYGCTPYGDKQRSDLIHNPKLDQSGYIFVYQDLRSRSMSEGDPEFVNLMPVYSQRDDKRTDESTDAYDSIEWMLKNIEGHNGKVGMWGNSYMGWTALMGAVSAHPNLKTVVAAAPPVDIYFEDFNRYGMYTLAYTPILDWFGTPKRGQHQGPWWENQLAFWADGKRFGLSKDCYEFYRNQGPLRNFDELVGPENYFWKFLKDHPNYDSARQERNTLQYLRGIKSSVMIVGGLNDEQNLYGIFNAYRTIEANNPAADCRLVVGPWTHGQHQIREKQCYVGNVFYGENLTEHYQSEIEANWIEWQLKGKPDPGLPEVTIYDTGTRQWLELDALVTPILTPRKLFFDSRERLSGIEPTSKDLTFEFVSNPAKPVPYIESDEISLFPAKHFMTDDQRFTSKRPDVLTFATPPLESSVSMIGPLNASLEFSTDRTDADLIVKLIDVYPMDRQSEETDKPNIKMNGYQQLVRMGQIRGRYRNGFETPKPFEPNRPTDITVELLDVCHTFKPGHRIMIQVQSSMFPLFDRNPQNYVDNIFLAEEKDFVRANHTVYRGSSISFTTRESPAKDQTGQ